MDVRPQLRIFWPTDSEPVTEDHSASASLPALDAPQFPVEATTSLTDGKADAELPREGGTMTTLWQRLIPFTGSLMLVALLSGCSAFRPLRGMPVQALPPECRGVSRANMETIDLSRLGQTPAQAYLLDSGDVLAVYVEGVLGPANEVPPVYIPQNSESNPSLGYPIPVREDGTISLPLVAPINVRGMTVSQVEDLVRRTYTADREILQKGRERILVSLQRARTYKVTVLRQETSNVQMVSQSSGSIQLGQTKQGTGQIVVLQAGENDVLHALTVSGGLPGLDAQNAIYVLRRPRQPMAPARLPITAKVDAKPAARARMPIILTSAQSNPYTVRYGNATPIPATPQQFGHSLPTPDPNQPVELESPAVELESPAPAILPARRQAPPPPPDSLDPRPATQDTLSGPYYPPELQPYLSSGVQLVRIPIRLHPGEEALFSESDIMLYDGDIVFIESRSTEVFYTGGLLGGGQYLLPRDYDLEVLDAISIAQSQTGSVSGGGFGSRIGGISAVNQDISVSASDLVIIRRFPDGQRMNIKVNLNRALQDPNENLIIQPGDLLVLRYRPMEAIGAFIERNLLAGSLIGLATQQQGN